MPDRSEVRAGAFVLMALLILGAGTLWILGSPMGGADQEYEVQMKSSGGVRRGDRVRLSGLEVGRITEIGLLSGEERPVLLSVAIDEEVRLTRGSSARLTTDGLLGAPYLELVAGPSNAELLPPGSRILGTEQTDLNQALGAIGAAGERLPQLLDVATATLDKVERDLEPILQSMQRLLSAENVDTMSRVIRKLEPTVEDVGARLSALGEQLDVLATELEEGLGGIPELTTELRGLVSDLRAAVGPDGSRLTGVLESAGATIDTADGALSTFEVNRGELDSMVRDLRESAANLRSLTQNLKERPGLLLRSPKLPERQPGAESEQ